MNRIAHLQTDLAAAHGALQAKAEALQELRVHLHGEKFTGTAVDGSRKDWIAVSDVHAWIAHISAAEA